MNCLIIGSGPAGYTAAIYASRANLHPVLIEGLQVGGQLMITTEVENFPGYPEGVEPYQMMDDMRRQAERFGTEFVSGMVTKVDFSCSPKKVWVEDTQLYEADTVIVATGASAKFLGIQSEEDYKGRGVITDEMMISIAGMDNATVALLKDCFIRKYFKTDNQEEIQKYASMLDALRLIRAVFAIGFTSSNSEKFRPSLINMARTMFFPNIQKIAGGVKYLISVIDSLEK